MQASPYRNRRRELSAEVTKGEIANVQSEDPFKSFGGNAKATFVAGGASVIEMDMLSPTVGDSLSRCEELILLLTSLSTPNMLNAKPTPVPHWVRSTKCPSTF